MSSVGLGLFLFGVFVIVLVAVSVYFLYREARRRWRVLRNHAVTQVGVAAYGAIRQSPMWSRFGPGRHALATPARLRHELSRDVTAATRAVREAQDAGASVGGLPALCRRLADSAADLDRLLVMAGGLDASAPAMADLRRQVLEVLEASTSIRLAALAAGNDAASMRVKSLTADAEGEIRCLDAGVAQSQAAFSDFRA